MKKSLSPLLKLTNFELSRLSKFLFTLMGLTVLANLVGYIYIPMKFMDKINKFTIESSATTEEVLNSLGTLSFYDVTMSLWIVAPIAIGVSGLLFYSVFIWYREWFGKNTFAYRLLMLPVSRMTLFFSKFIVIFIGIFTLISTQIVSLFIGYPIVSAIVDSTYFSSLGLIESMYMHPLFLILFPLEPNYFLILIVGATVLLVMFTLILMERSFASKGILFGIGYAMVALAIVLFPLFLSDIFNNNYLIYGSELVIIEVVLMIIVSISSLFTSRYLINNKITV
ncbi:MAG: hypothetical protein L0I88_03135 [Alkalibacterium sp.]|uniref:hypothetical protein n=1 Tax=Alkalibacterium TaxID=99906 RepID=UPI002649EAA3|nr:hypothetical protein [Alkalibacterium sp.]MDN6194015.1 hypothetical protein [Alkalibacterium sp.]MDN6293283.1 hypothetical protein [Alkalibacterium sp.]MDN6295491.1 hypothetical protein [Alkalibacterium sp.]